MRDFLVIANVLLTRKLFHVRLTGYLKLIRSYMPRKNTDDVMSWEEAEKAEKLSGESGHSRRMRIFMEMMEDVYGKDVRKSITPSELISRHRDIAAKLMLIKTDLPKRSDLFAPPKAEEADIIN